MVSVISKYDENLGKCPANYQSLTPISFLERCSLACPNKIAVIDGATSFDYKQFFVRCKRLGSALRKYGVGKGDTVSVMAPNVPALLEAHYGVPMIGAVINAMNTRLDADAIAFILAHAETKVLLTDRAFSTVMEVALQKVDHQIMVVDIDHPQIIDGKSLGNIDYEGLLDEGDPHFKWHRPDDEWDAIALNYTSGTTGDPKGVVYHHRGAYLNAMGSSSAFGFTSDTTYLWTLPMFHCNGWCNTWGISVVGGTHVCLRTVDPSEIFNLIRKHRVTHLAGAPVVLNMLIHAPKEVKDEFIHGPIEIATGGAAPPSSVLSGMQEMGFNVRHLYGLTESYGPSTVCDWQPEWDALEFDAQVAKVARQGVRTISMEDQRVVDLDTQKDVPFDAETVGEIVLRSNTIMKGYLKNAHATKTALKGGWFHTGDLAVVHPDGYVEIKDRAKDIIISGGENISSLEVEEVLYRHPLIMEAAVVAVSHDKWGETPCAFVTLVGDAGCITEEEIILYCRENMANFKVPSRIVFGELPKTSTGKIQKFALRELAKKG
ncbi:MAG: AMP-binding protein [Pseudomonadota bacterium]|nr:AMP-binding protein [Pseudomonadota bacterium]